MFDRTETRPFRRLAGVSAGMLMLAACTSSGVTNSLNTSDIDRAGGPAGSGGGLRLLFGHAIVRTPGAQQYVPPARLLLVGIGVPGLALPGAEPLSRDAASQALRLVKGLGLSSGLGLGLGLQRTVLIAMMVAGTILAGCTSTTGSARSTTSAGPICGYYAGSKFGSGSGAQDVIRERRCFSSLSACRSWLRGAQNRAPGTFLRKPCGTS